MKLYNTLTRSLEPFKPLDTTGRKVGMYACGPTVYDAPHLGHIRSAYVFDVLRRYLAFKGYQVAFVRNVTDVDDKIIAKAREELKAGDTAGRPRVRPSASASMADAPGAGELKEACRVVAQRYLESYHRALEPLGIQAPDQEPRATEHVVPDMTDSIAQLLMNGIAYEAGGDVYFSVRKFPGYGALSNRTPDALQAGARVEPGEHKQDPLDFALWKAAKPDEPAWESPWGKGRPGWHIECSVMSTSLLGDAFDIHGGGVDLVFPHHENEIAQARTLGKPFASIWLHHGLMTVNGDKMSKSIGNFITVEKALEACGDDVEILKMFFLSTHYRKPIDYTDANLQAAEGRWSGLYGFVERAEVAGSVRKESGPAPQELDDLEQEFVRAMDQDMNTPQALAVLDRLAERGHQWNEEWDRRYEQWQEAHPDTLPVPAEVDDPEAERLRAAVMATAERIRRLAGVLGLSLSLEGVALTTEQQARLKEREDARKRKDFSRADQIRKQFIAEGLIIEDTAKGYKILRKR